MEIFGHLGVEGGKHFNQLAESVVVAEGEWRVDSENGSDGESPFVNRLGDHKGRHFPEKQAQAKGSPGSKKEPLREG